MSRKGTTWLWLALFGIFLFTAGPLLIALPSVVAAFMLGCTSNAVPCTVFGINIEDFLQFLSLFHWFLIVTIPIGALAFIAWLTVALGVGAEALSCHPHEGDKIILVEDQPQ